MPSDHTSMLSIMKVWSQRRDSNSQTPVSKTGCYSNSHTLALWCTGEDLNLRVPLGETGLQPVRFGRAHTPVQTWRKVDESNAHRSSRRPGFQDQLPAIQGAGPPLRCLIYPWVAPPFAGFEGWAPRRGLLFRLGAPGLAVSCLVPRHALQFVPGHPLHFEFMLRTWGASARPRSEFFLK